MALIQGKYQRLGLDLLKDEYRELFMLATEKGCTMASLGRNAIRALLREAREQRRKGGLYKV